MDNLIVKSVDMMGDTVMAAKDKDGQIWAGVSYFCKGLGMNKKQKDTQTEKVQNDEVLKRGATKFPAGVFDQNNETIALRLDFVPIWLTKISVTPSMKKDHPDLAEKLLNYQLKAKDILAAAFMPKNQFPQTIDGQIKLLAQGYTDIKEEVDTIKSDLESLKMDLPILPIEAETITNAVKAKGVHVMGGKDSNAYRDRSIVNSVYRDIYGQIYRNFGVSSYKAVKRSQTERVLEIVGKYEPPVILADRILDANAQQKLDM